MRLFLCVVIVCICSVLCVQRADASCSADAKRLDDYEQSRQSEGPEVAIGLLQAALKKHEECRAEATPKSLDWIDETVAAGFDALGLSTDLWNGRWVNQSREAARTTHSMLTDLCWARASLDARQRAGASMLRWLYEESPDVNHGHLQPMADCFKSSGKSGTSSVHQVSQSLSQIPPNATLARPLTSDEKDVVNLTISSEFSQQAAQVQAVSVVDNYGLTMYQVGTKSGIAMFAKKNKKWALVQRQEATPSTNASGATTSNMFISQQGEISSAILRRLFANLTPVAHYRH